MKSKWESRFTGNPTNLVSLIRARRQGRHKTMLPCVDEENISVYPLCAIVGYAVLTATVPQRYTRRELSGEHREVYMNFKESDYMTVHPKFPFWVPGNSFLGGCTIDSDFCE